MTSPTGISNQSAIVRNFYSDDAMILDMYVTCSKQQGWLIGDPLQNILGAKLPSSRDVMRNLVHYHRVKNVNIQDAANRVYTQIIPMWEKVRIPTKAK